MWNWKKTKLWLFAKLHYALLWVITQWELFFFFIRSLPPTQGCSKSFKHCVLGAHTGLKSELNHILPSLMHMEIPTDTAETKDTAGCFPKHLWSLWPTSILRLIQKRNVDVWSVPWVFETLVENSGRSCRDCLYHHQLYCSFQKKDKQTKSLDNSVFNLMTLEFSSRHLQI